MADPLQKNIQIKDVEGNLLFPKTKAAVVLNNNNENLGGVEAGAQVNIIEEVQVNGTALAITDKKVNVVIPAADEYTLAKQATAEEGMSATYYMTKNGTQVGEKINIPKDMVVQSGDLKVCTEAGKPVAGLAVGDPYIDLVIANNDGSHIYIPVKGLVDIYTAGDDTIIVENNTIKVSLTELQKTFYTESEVDAELAKKVDKNTAITAGTKCKITYDAKGLVTAGADLEQADIPSLNLTKIGDVTATAAEVNVLDGIEASTTELNYVKGVTAGIQGQIDAKVAKNADITGATKCKITYDAKGLVTAGADLTQDDIPALNLTKVSDVTATAAEVNALHEAGAVKADFEKLHTITATAAELNIMDGVTATTAEINYLSGVTSNIQAQINAALTYEVLA